MGYNKLSPVEMEVFQLSYWVKYIKF
jgi:hypothetical protein